ncbi:dTMP kinase [Francisellaceae bacterium]|nr:dTMP kinase [Francisellaceae bacterium]
MTIFSKLIVIEGLEGAGKSTIIQKLKDYTNTLTSRHYLYTREPGGTYLAEKIRNIAIESNDNESLCDESELLLMYASRMQHINHLIIPTLMDQKFVISDRFYLSTYAYQGGGRQINMDIIDGIHNSLMKNICPGLTIYLDISPEIGLKRIQIRNNIDRIESEKVTFFERAREVYLTKIKDENNYVIIDASKNITTVCQDVLDAFIKYTNKFS